MVKIGHIFKEPFRKIIYVFAVTVMLYIAISGIFSIPMNQTTLDISKKAGGLSFYTIGALFLLTVLKAAFLEFVENSIIRSRGQKIFQFLHKFLGWIIFILAVYHSLFFIYYYIWPVAIISISRVITGICAMICLVFIMILGKKAMLNFSFESVYFRHVFATIVLILLTIIHLNFL